MTEMREWDGSPELTEKIQRAYAEAERGETVDLGDFGEYLRQGIRERIVRAVRISRGLLGRLAKE
jgi:hypothetical protein